MQTRRILAAALSAVALLAAPLGAQEEKQEYAAPDAEGAAMMEAYAQAGAPGAHHEWLAGLAGEWDVQVTFLNMGPEPVTTRATSRSEMIHGGRFLLEQLEGSFMGQPFEASNVTGYNNLTERFEAGWIDNHSTGLFTYRGERDGDVLTLAGEAIDPVTGETVKHRSVLEKVSDDRIEVAGFEDRGSGWQKSMEIVYTRRS